MLTRIKLLLKFINITICEWFKYDAKGLPYIGSSIFIGVSIFMKLVGKDKTTMQILSKVHRLQWPFVNFVCSIFLIRKDKLFKSGDKYKRILVDYVDSSNNLTITDKFVQNPEKLFPEMCIVLKGNRSDERGVILLKYSYSFPLFMKIFDIEKIAKKYFIVLEPSWNGYFDLNILCYHLASEPVFVQTQEPSDYKFLESIRTNLIPVNMGTNWWVDYNVFRPLNMEKEIDVIMVASWANFKRHYKFFRILREIKKHGQSIRVVLVGYPIQRTLEEIREQAEYFHVDDQIEFYEWLTPKEVNVQMNRARINLVWSRFEGNNRVILEGLFANIPFILREGFNYGYKYHFVNNETGVYANEDNLADTISYVLSNTHRFAPRKWAMRSMTYEIATRELFKAIRKKAYSVGEKFDEEMAYKVNELNGMRYVKPDDIARFKCDYDYIKSCIRIR